MYVLNCCVSIFFIRSEITRLVSVSLDYKPATHASHSHHSLNSHHIPPIFSVVMIYQRQQFNFNKQIEQSSILVGLWRAQSGPSGVWLYQRYRQFFFLFISCGNVLAISSPIHPSKTSSNSFFVFTCFTCLMCLMCVCRPSYSSFVASLIAVCRWVYIFLFCLNFDIIHEMAVIGHRPRAYRLSVVFSPIQWGYTIRPLIINPWKRFSECYIWKYFLKWIRSLMV